MKEYFYFLAVRGDSAACRQHYDFDGYAFLPVDAYGEPRTFDEGNLPSVERVETAAINKLTDWLAHQTIAAILCFGTINEDGSITREDIRTFHIG